MVGPRRWLALSLVLLGGCPEADIRPSDGGAALDAAAAMDASADAAPPDAGSRDASSPRDAATLEANVVFVTSSPITPATLGGVAVADALCNDLAMRAGLPEVGSYVAWLSTTSMHAITRLETSRGWVRPDGRPFVDRPDDLTDGRIWWPASLDEEGREVIHAVVTGSNVTGSLQDWACGDWGTVAGAEGGEVRWGWSTDGVRRWTSTTDQPCTVSGPIYCFGTGRVVPVTHDAHSGRLAFLSAERVTGDVGRDAMDALCDREATEAGWLDRSFVALVASGDETVLDRLVDGEPWVRPDGVLVARDRSDVARSSLNAAVNVTADRRDYLDDMVWIGATGPDLRPRAREDCEGWSDPTSQGVRGRGGSAQQLFDTIIASCDATQPVLCFER